MKTRINKLVVFVTMAAIAIFVSASTASANGPLDIIGEYGFSGGGNIIETPYANWDPNNPFTLKDPTKVSFVSYHAYGIVTFNHNGTGTLDCISLGTLTAPLFTGASVWNPSYYHITYPFTYTIDKEGKITSEAVTNAVKQEALDPVTGMPTGMVAYKDHFSLTGYVSPDHKTITFATTAPIIDTLMVETPGGLMPLFKIISHESYVANRLTP